MTNTTTCVDIEGNTYEVPSDELQWRPSAYGIVIKDNRVLLSKQFGSKYDLPGGGIDLGEDLKAGVMREVKEETGIDVDNPQALGIENSFFHAAHASKNSYHSILVYYVCNYIGGELSTDGFDEYEKQYADMAEWIPVSSIDDIEIASTVDFRPYIKQAARLT
jgi:8-oxo-dGTP diphosphatase